MDSVCVCCTGSTPSCMPSMTLSTLFPQTKRNLIGANVVLCDVMWSCQLSETSASSSPHRHYRELVFNCRSLPIYAETPSMR